MYIIFDIRYLGFVFRHDHDDRQHVLEYVEKVPAINELAYTLFGTILMVLIRGTYVGLKAVTFCVNAACLRWNLPWI